MDFSFILQMIPKMLPALKNTLYITFLSALFGWAFGIIIAVIREKRVRFWGAALNIYVSFMRSVPLVIIMFFCYFAVPTLIALYRYEHGLDVASAVGNTSIICPVIALTLSEAAFFSETFRSALAAIPGNQMEAAKSVGMSEFTAYRRILFPQAFTIALPNIGGLFIGLLKSSTLAYYSGVVEITGYAYTLASPTYQFLEAFFVIALLYEVLTWIFSKVFSLLEQRVGKYRRGVVQA